MHFSELHLGSSSILVVEVNIHLDTAWMDREDNEPAGDYVAHSQVSFLKSKFLQKEDDVENM